MRARARAQRSRLPVPAQYSLIKRAGSSPPQIPERDCFVFARDHATLPPAKLIGDEKINRGAIGRPTDRPSERTDNRRPRHPFSRQMAVTGEAGARRIWREEIDRTTETKKVTECANNNEIRRRVLRAVTRSKRAHCHRKEQKKKEIEEDKRNYASFSAV